MLVRLHRRCRAAVAPHGRAHRLHDDRFAVGGRVTGATVAAALTALSERGAGFAIVGVPAVDLLGCNGRAAVPSRDTLVRDLEHARPELARHMRAVAALARGTGRELGLSGERLDELVRAAELHDVGKVAVPDAILDKDGPLTDDEAAFLRSHTVVGERILATAAPLGEAAELVRCSHERWDGFGYPDGAAPRTSPWGRGSSPCATPTRRWSPSATTRPRWSRRRRWPSCAARPGASSTPASSRRSSSPTGGEATPASRASYPGPRDHGQRSRARDRRMGPRGPRRGRGHRPASTGAWTRRTRRAAPSRPPTPASSPSSTAAGLVGAMEELATIQDQRRPRRQLRRAAASPPTPPTRRAARCCRRSQERATALETKLLFFELEWAALADERAEELLAADGLDFCRHHLRSARRYRPHLLTEPEEKVLTEKALTGRSRLGAPVRGADVGDRRSTCGGGEPVPLDVAPEPAAARPTATCAATPPRPSPRRSSPGLRTRAFVFNTLLADKAVDDRLRNYPTLAVRAQPRQRGHATSRCRRSSRPSAAATTSRSAGTGSRPSCSASTGSPTTTAWPPSPTTSDEFAWSRGARRSCSTPTTSFSPELARRRPPLLRRAVDRRPGPPGQARRRLLRVHGAVGATPTCCSTGPHAAATCSRSPTSSATACTPRWRARRASSTSRTPLTLAETASVFGETVTFGRLLEPADDPERGSRCWPRARGRDRHRVPPDRR